MTGRKHIALEKEKEQLTSQIEELAVKLNDNYESDEWKGENAFSKMARYQKDCQDHYRLEGKVERNQHASGADGGCPTT